MDKNRTLSDTKRSFYQYHRRPINSVYRRVVEELIVEMHLLSVNVDFRPEPIYYLGVCESFRRFMEGYTPERDFDSIFRALCLSVGGNPEEYQQLSKTLLEFAKNNPPAKVIDWLLNPTPLDGLTQVAASWRQALDNPRFKYSRLFAIGLYTLMTASDEELAKNQDKFIETIQPLAARLNLPVEKLKKDLDLYRSNLDKMKQMLSVMSDILEAARKKRQEESSAKNGANSQ